MNIFQFINSRKLPRNPILFISDTHGHISKEEINELGNYEAVILMGDIYQSDLDIILPRLKNVPIYGLLGNHDDFSLLKYNKIENFHGKIISLFGISIAGFQGCNKYKNAKMPMYTDEESVEIASKMKEAKILISHDRAKVKNQYSGSLAKSGMAGISNYLKQYDVKYHIHGHMHDTYFKKIDGVKTVCIYKTCIKSLKELFQ